MKSNEALKRTNLSLPAASPRALPGHASSRLELPLLLALLVLLATRLGVIFGIELVPSSDPAWYYQRAIELVEHRTYSEHGVPTAYWPVGYPAFLAVVMAIFGRSVTVGQVANLVLSAVSLVLLYVWCRRHWQDRRVAALAVLLFALYPNQVGYSVVLYSEPLFITLLLAIAVVGRPGASAGRLIALGLLAGAATLVKAQTQLLAPLLIWLLLLSEWRPRAAWDATRRTLLAVLVMLLTIAPWTGRNYLQFGALIPVSTNGGMSLLVGNNPSMPLGLGGGEFAEDDALVRSAHFSIEDQVAADTRARHLAWSWIAENPGRFIELIPRKILRLWLWDGESEWMFQRGDPNYERHQALYRSIRGANQVFYLIVLAAGLFGLMRLTELRRPATWVPALTIVFFTALSAVFSGQSRYHAPLMPFILAGSAWTFVELRKRWGRP